MLINFEVNRLANTYLSAAYEKLVPVIKRSFHEKKSPMAEEKIQKLKGSI